MRHPDLMIKMLSRNNTKFSPRFQLYARAYVSLWTLRSPAPEVLQFHQFQLITWRVDCLFEKVAE